MRKYSKLARRENHRPERELFFDLDYTEKLENGLLFEKKKTSIVGIEPSTFALKVNAVRYEDSKKTLHRRWHNAFWLYQASKDKNVKLYMMMI